MSFTTKRLGAADLAAMKGCCGCSARYFGDYESYQGKMPSDAYLLDRLR